MTEVSGLLRQLYIHSIPTAIFVIVLFLILDRLFFRPITEVMRKRADATVGALEWARKQTNEAEAKSREYAAALHAARVELYSVRQDDRQKALAERESALKAARERGDGLVKEAQASIAAEAAAAKEQLTGASQSLALEITERILGEGLTPNANPGARL
jgi:F-type H+-transporting ATPase subunit b